MKEEKRKCVKCGHSLITDPDVKLYRFPCPGTKNTLRCELWAKYCFPEGAWSSQQFQAKLYSSHKMLCDRHFRETAFSSLMPKKLYRFAVPEKEEFSSEDSVEAAVMSLSQNDHSYAMKRPHSPNEYIQTTDPTSALSSGLDDFRPLAPKEPPCQDTRAAEASGLSNDDHSYAMKRPHSPNGHLPAMAPTSGVTSALVDFRPPAPKEPPCKDSGVAEASGLSNNNNSYATKRPHSPNEPLETTDPTSIAISIALDDFRPPAPKKPKITRMIQQRKDYPSTSKTPTKTAKVKLQNSTPREKQLYRKCRRNMKELCRLKKKLRQCKNETFISVLSQNKDLNELMNNKMTSTFAVLLQAQLRNYKCKAQGRRWTKPEKILALRMYKRSPACYKLLRRLWCLPTQSTLKALLATLPLGVGINDQVFNVLKQISETNEPEENEYILMFDEMSIKKNLWYNPKTDAIEGYQDHGLQGRSMEIASHALVFMICGIRRKMKQPVAYYFSGECVTADRLAVLIKEVLDSCFKAGINVSATVCDMDGVNKRALNILGSSVEHPSFVHSGHEIVSMFDSPHLLKCFRNLFLKYNIKCQTDIKSSDITGCGIAKWSHINEFYEADNSNPNFVFAPALRKEHLNPNSKQKMKVNLAAQVMSHTVAAGMCAKISKGELPTDATITATVVSKIDELFDAVNADTPDLKRGKPYSTNLSKRSPHIEFLKEMKQFFKNLEFVGCKRRPPSQDGWIHTLNAIEKLWDNLSKKYDSVKSLCTRRLQQDPLENTFGCIRGNCGSNINPTATQFVGGLKTAILSNLAHIGVGRNCENDDNQVLHNLETLLTPSNKSQNYFPDDSLITYFNNVVEDTFESSTIIDSGEIQACAYVCGFINKKHDTNCKTCRSLLVTEEVENVHIFTEFKEYRDFKKSLTYSTINFIKCVEYCASFINEFLKIRAHTFFLRQTIVNNLKGNEIFCFLRECNIHCDKTIDFIINSVFFICIKRFCCLQNRKFADQASASALKRKINILKHV